MAYRQTTIMDAWDVILRWHDRQGIRQIAQSTGFDRKTVQGYRRMAVAVGLSLDVRLQTFSDTLCCKLMDTFSDIQVVTV